MSGLGIACSIGGGYRALSILCRLSPWLALALPLFLFLPLNLPPCIRLHLPPLPSRIPTHPTHLVLGTDARFHELDVGTVDGHLVLLAGDVVDVRAVAVVGYEELAHWFREGVRKFRGWRLGLG